MDSNVSATLFEISEPDLIGFLLGWAYKYQDEPDLLDDFNINYWTPIFSKISPLKLMMYRSEDFEE